METEITLTVECEGEFVPETKMIFTSDYPNGLPGEPACVQNFRVYLERFSKRENGTDVFQKLEITDWLSQYEYDKLYKEFLEQEMSK